jgi:beta-lactam-binding protein with PASTA domain
MSMSPLEALLNKIFPKKSDSPEQEFFHLTVVVAVGTILLMTVFTLTFFFLSLRSEEQFLVPDVQGYTLREAIEALQDQELNVRVLSKYTDLPEDRDKVMDQSPKARTLLKAGRKVTLTVSRGAGIDTVPEYIGMQLEEVRSKLRLLSTQSSGLLRLDNASIIQEFNDAPEGTVLQQTPEPGTQITEPIELSLVVSNGPKGRLVEVPAYEELPYTAAMNSIFKYGWPYVVSSRPAQRGEDPGIIISQNPAQESNVTWGTIISLVMTEPNIPEAKEGQPQLVFGILEYDLDFEAPTQVKVELVESDGNRTMLHEFRFFGGAFTYPYLVEAGSQIIVSAADEQLYELRVQP